MVWERAPMRRLSYGSYDQSPNRGGWVSCVWNYQKLGRAAPDISTVIEKSWVFVSDAKVQGKAFSEADIGFGFAVLKWQPILEKISL